MPSSPCERPEHQRRPIGFFKIPDIENRDEETINAVDDAIYSQMIQQVRAAGREIDADRQRAGSSTTAAVDQDDTDD